MTVKILSCRPRDENLMQAVLVTVDNLDEVAAWCGGHVVNRDIGQPAVQLPDERDPMAADWAEPGQYAVKGCTGRYWALEAWMFERDYEVTS